MGAALRWFEPQMRPHCERRRGAAALARVRRAPLRFHRRRAETSWPPIRRRPFLVARSRCVSSRLIRLGARVSQQVARCVREPQALVLA